jgi:hypothetical protein
MLNSRHNIPQHSKLSGKQCDAIGFGYSQEYAG